MKIFRKSMHQSIGEEPILTLWNGEKKDFEDLLFYTTQIFEETKEEINRILVRSSIDSLTQKVDIIFEISRLQNLVDGWIQRFKYALSESCCSINEMKIGFKNSMKDTKRHITRIFFLLNQLQKDGKFDKQFLRSLQTKGLIDMDEYDIYARQKKDIGKYWAGLTVHEKREILATMREKAMVDLENRPMTILQRIKCLSCISKPRRRAPDSVRKGTVLVNKLAKSSADVGVKGDKTYSIPETKRRNFRNSLSAFCRSVSAFFTA